MKNRLSNINIPPYTYKQEMFNSISHFAGVFVGLVILSISFILKFTIGLNNNYFIGLIIFGISAILLYLVSSLYHIESPLNETSKKIKRIIDHCTIYVLIAGTYTPICIYIMQTNQIGLILLIIEWSLAFVGFLINAIRMENKIIKIISMSLYLILGWLLLFSTAFMYMPLNSFIFVLVGGIIYTIGSISYGIGHKNLNFHGIFHIFVLLGTIFQAIGVIILFV